MDGLALQAVPLLDVRHRDVIFACDAAEALSFLHRVGDKIAHLLHLFLDDLTGLLGLAGVGIDAVFELGETQRVFHGHTQGAREVPRSGDDTLGVLRVEEDEVLHRHADAFVDLVEAYALVHHHCVGAMQQQARIGGIDVMLGGVVHQVGDGNERRHITSRLLGQIRPDGPVVLDAARTDDGLVDRAWTRVVGRQHEEPVLIASIEALQVLAGRHGLLHGVIALVEQGGDTQAIVLARTQHKLPQAFGSRLRACRRVECRLHHGEVFQLQWEVVLGEVFLEHGEIDV